MQRNSVPSFLSNQIFCKRQLERIKRHFGYHVELSPYSCALLIPDTFVLIDVLRECYLVYVCNDNRAFASQVELVRTAGDKVELCFAEFNPFVQEGSMRIETSGTYLSLGPVLRLIPFSPHIAGHHGTTMPPGLPS
jgi:hypothetical protein